MSVLKETSNCFFAKIAGKIIFIVVFMVTLLLFTMCNKENEPEEENPVANFTIVGGNKPAPHKISLINTSQNTLSYTWDFGDGATSFLKEPTHIYQEAGTYSITLTGINGSMQNTITKSVTILPKPTRVSLMKLTLTDFPESNNGEGWDEDSPADVMFEITFSNISVLFASDIKYDLLHSQLPVYFTEGLPYTFNDFGTPIYFKFYDCDDVTNKQYLGGYYFHFNSYVPSDGSDYPSTITFNSVHSTIKFKLNVEWSN